MPDPTPRAGGARRAERGPRRGPTGPTARFGTALALVMIVAAAFLLVLVTPATPGAPPAPEKPTGAPVSRTTLGCPALTEVDDAETSYGVALAAVEGLPDDGTVSVDPGGSLSLTRGQATDAAGTRARGLAVLGAGGFAQGLLAWRADTGAGTALTQCLGPQASWWFTGAGATLDHASTLTLTNLDSGPAVVDLRVLSAQGEVEVDETGARGITLDPGARESVPLVGLAPQNEELSIWVHATRGRVVAAVRDRLAEAAGAPSGDAWLPAQTVPSRLVRLSGTPSRATSRTLLVANPSSLESVVTVELAGPDGRFVPADLEDVSVAPGTVQEVDLPDVPSGAFAVRVRAERPVVAALRSVLRNGEIGYAGAAPALDGPAALPAVGDASVQLTAGGETARATATAYSNSGVALDDTKLSLAPHSTGAWALPARAAYVVVEPVQGSVHGAVVYDDAAAQPLLDLPVEIRIPVVKPAD